MNFEEWYNIPGRVFHVDDIQQPFSYPVLKANLRMAWDGAVTEMEKKVKEKTTIVKCTTCDKPIHQYYGQPGGAFGMSFCSKSCKEVYHYRTQKTATEIAMEYNRLAKQVYRGPDYLSHISKAFRYEEWEKKMKRDIEDLKQALSVPKFTMEENKMCKDCEPCEKHYEKTGECTEHPDLSLVHILERCPWPSRRMVKKTKFEKFCEQLNKEMCGREPLPGILRDCMRIAGYDTEEQ
jgi:hypothetical protein